MIEIEHLNKTYPSPTGDIHALRDVDLRIDDREIFGIIGLSGAGKSTLVRCINLLERPTSGTVRIDGRDMTQLSRRDLLKARHDRRRRPRSDRHHLRLSEVRRSDRLAVRSADHSHRADPAGVRHVHRPPHRPARAQLTGGAAHASALSRAAAREHPARTNVSPAEPHTRSSVPTQIMIKYNIKENLK